MPAGYVKPYVQRGKNDALDAAAICEAVSRPTMRFAAIKSVEQQSALTLHRARVILIKQKTMLANLIRGCRRHGESTGMTDRNPFLREYPPDRPADSRCTICAGQGVFYDGEWARTCHCRYSPNFAEVSPVPGERGTRK